MWTTNSTSPTRFSTICGAADRMPRRFFRFAVLGLVMGGIGFLSSRDAAAQKVGYIASDAIFQRLPQAVDARAKLSEMQGKWTREIRTMEEQATALRGEIERNRLLWSAQERTQKEGELRDVEAKLAEYRTKKFGPNGEFETQYQQLMAPVIELVSVAVTAEAEAQSVDFVFDKSSRGLPMLFANPEYDLTYAVLKRLGVEVDPSELEAREKKPLQLLPGTLPIELGNSEGGINPTLKVDPAVEVPVGGGMKVEAEMQQSAKVEVDPNMLLNPAPEEPVEEDPSEP